MTAWLLVRRADLAREVTRLARLARLTRAKHARAEAVLTFSDGRLTIALPGMAVGVPADGTWVPRVRVPAHMFLDLGRHLPKEDPLLIKAQEGHLVVGGHAIPCQYDHPELSLIRLPANASLADILRAAATHTPEEIERSGLSRLVRQAEVRRKRLIARGARILKHLWVSDDDLHRLVEQRLFRLPSPPWEPWSEKRIARAAAILKPLEISEYDIGQLVSECRRRHQSDLWEDEAR